MVEEVCYMDDRLYNAARHGGTDIQNFLTGELFRIRTVGDESNVLHVAAQYGNLGFINTVLKELPNHHFHLLCKQNSKGETPLHLAAELGNSEIVKTLLRAHDNNSVSFGERKECWSVWDKRGDTPVHRALKYGNEDVALSLLEKDMQLVSVCNNASESLAYLAAENFCQKFMKEILKAHRYDPSSVSFSGPFERTVFHPARKLNGNIMSTLIQRRTYLLKAQERNTKKTVLHYAVEEHMESLVKTLLMADSTLAYLHDKDGMTPLHRAAKMGSLRMIRIILELSPQSLTILDKRNGQTALHIAKMDASSLAGCLKSTRMKELINVADKNGNTPLHLALMNSDLASANKLLEVDAVNWRLTNEQGYSPMDLCTLDDQIPFKMKSLASACRVKEGVTNTQIFHRDVVNADDLLDHYRWEECLAYKGPQGDSILHIAARDGQMKIIKEAHNSASDKLLLLSGQNSKGETPLHLAAQHGQLKVVKSILKLCTPIEWPRNHENHSISVPIDNANENQVADIMPWRTKSNNGETPIHKALINKHENIALRLLSFDPELVYSENHANDTLLYHAVEYRCNLVLKEILSRTRGRGYNSPCTRGADGQNVLHVAARSGEKTLDLCMSLFRNQPNLINEVDDNGKTPSHYAIEAGGCGITNLLKEDKTAAFVYDNEGFTPLLRAAIVGYMPSIKHILDLCPQSAELRVASNNKTFLHLAHGPRFFFQKCMEHPVMLKLINETDKEGNTALHCAILDEDFDKASVLLRTKGINWKIRNKQHQSPTDLCNILKRSGKTEQIPIHAKLDLLDKKEHGPPRAMKCIFSLLMIYKHLVLLTEDNVKKLLDKIAVAAALLIAITFAAAFSGPMGGSDKNTGDVKRVDQIAANVFIVSDVFAMLMAVSILLKYTIEVRPERIYHLAMTSIFLLQISLGFTVVAFLSGVYAIVSHAKLLIAIPVVVSALIHLLLRFKLEITGFNFW